LTTSDDLRVAVGHPAELAVAVHPAVGSLHRPAPSGLDGGGHALAGDLAGKAQFGEGLAGGLAVVTSVEVAGALAGQQAAKLADRGLQGGCQQRRVVPVGARGSDAQRDARSLGGDRAFQAAFAPVHRGGPGELAAAWRLGHAPIDRHIGQFQADDLVIRVQRQGMDLLADTPLGPVFEPAADRPVRAPAGGDPLIPAAVH
jgi:hypothetical protein